MMEWKSLNFFDILPVMNENKNKLKCIKSKITSFCYNFMFNIFCDINGFVYVLGSCYGPGYELLSSFRANKAPIQKCAISANNEINYVVTLAEDTANNDFHIKVFNITNVKSKKSPPLIGNSHINICDSVSSMQISNTNNGVLIAVATQKGDLYFHQSSTATNLNFRCFNISINPINAIHFISSALLVCTDTEIISYNFAENYSIEKKCTLDTKNLDTKHFKVECSSTGYLHDEFYLFIGRRDAIYCFTSDSRGPCYAVEGEKRYVASFKHFLVIIVTKMGNLFPQQPLTVLIVLDIQNKLVVLEKNLDGVAGILSSGNQCFIFTNANELYLLQEHSSQVRIQLLLRKGLFDIALRIAESDFCDEGILANVFLKYGDHLISKGNYESAIEKYVKTLGVIDPYIIIQKLLDSRLNTWLYKYLEALIKSGHGHARNRHIKLLLKCNERLNLTANVDTYLNAGSLPQYCLHKVQQNRNLILDVSYSAFVNIIDNDRLSYEFFLSMDEKQIFDFFSEHSRILFQNFPTQIISILKKLCSKNKPLIHAPERFIPLLLEYKDLCLNFLEEIVNSVPDIDSSVYNMFFELQLQSKNNNELHLNKLLIFLSNNFDHLNETHILLLCKLYMFWPGIKLLNEKLPRKNIFYSNSAWPQIYLTLATINSEESSSLNVLSISKFSNDVPPRNKINTFIKEMCSSGKCLLEIMHCIFRRKNITVGQINEVFNQNNSNLSNNNCENVSKLSNQVRFSDNTLNSYLFCPIEFRSNICNICRQEIYLPAVFFLCQHVFHKDCLTSYSQTESCTICTNNRSFIRKNVSAQNLEYISVEKISQMIAANYFKTLRNYFKANNSIIAISSEYDTSNSLNPFEDGNVEYSNNMNPFESNNPFEVYDSNLNPFDQET